MKFFGKDTFGNDVYKYEIGNDKIKFSVLSLGGVLQSLCVKNADKQWVDVVLGYDNCEGYASSGYLGALVGRNANRIAGGRFQLDGEVYNLTKNQGENQLHGGTFGFDKKIWNIETGDSYISCKIFSPHGEQGFAGNMQVEVKYTLLDCGVEIEYSGISDRKTVFNMTNHAYFNLNGEGCGDVLATQLEIYADGYTPIDSTSIPLGSVDSVQNTPFDFRISKAIGKEIEEDFLQLVLGSGYDHNFAVAGESGKVRKVAKAVGDRSGIVMTVESDTPGVQLYTGNFLDVKRGKGGKIYGKRDGFCLETQCFPDAVNQEGFEKPFIEAGEEKVSVTRYIFSRK